MGVDSTRRGWRRAAVVVAAAIMGWSMEGIPQAVAQPVAQPILIGSLNDITGFASIQGINERDGQRLAVKYVNSRGGIGGRPLQLVERDTAGDANKTVQYFEELASDPRIAAITGFSTSNDANAVKALANATKTPMVACVAAPSYTDGDISYLYRSLLSDAYLPRGILQFVQKDLKGKTIALLMQNDAFGQGAQGVLQRIAPEYGLTIIAVENMGSKDTDVTPQLTKIKQRKPDAIVSYGTGLVSAVINRNREALGMLGVPLIGPQNWGESGVIQASGRSAEGVYVASTMAMADLKPGIQSEIAKQYEAEFGKPLATPGVIFGYDALMLVAEGLKTMAPIAGNVDRTKLKAAMDKLNYQGGIGDYKLSPTVHEVVGADAVVIGVIENGKWIRASSRSKK